VNIPSVNPHAIDGRVVPDVAALAGSPWYEVVIDNKLGGNGGTSAATPLWASLICRIVPKLPAGKRLPFLTPLLYQVVAGSTVGAAGCNDITTGDNDTASVGGYTAGSGFDAVTGWGSPNGMKLLQALGPLAI
jgi:kumamolisin